MTELVGQVRALLDRTGAGKAAAAGVPCALHHRRVPRDGARPAHLGPATGWWDHVAPQDTMYAEANIPYAEWRKLTEGGRVPASTRR